MSLNMHHYKLKLVGEAQSDERENGVGNTYIVGIYLASQQHEAQ